MAPIYSWNFSAYAAVEGAFGAGPGTGGTAGVFAATDAIEYITANPPPVQKRMTEPRADRTGTRSKALAMVHNRFDPVGLTIDRSIANSGTATTPPDTTALMTVAFGTETVGGSNVTYSIAESPTNSVAVMLAEDGGAIVHIFYGGAVPTYRINVPDGGSPTENFELEFSQYSVVAADTLTATDGVVTTVTVGNANRFVNPFGIVLRCESEDILTSSDPADWAPSTGTFTNVTRAHNSTSGAAHTAAAVTAKYPGSKTTAGAPVGDHQVTASYHGTTVVIRTGTMEFQTGRQLRAHERGANFRQGIEAQPVEVSISMSGLLDTGADTEILGAAVHNDAGTFILNVGDVAGSKYVATAAVGEVGEATPVDPGTEEPINFELSSMAYGSSGNDDVAIVTS